MKELLKKLIFPTLHLIRKILTIIKINALPNISPPSVEVKIAPSSAYDVFRKEEILNCYNHFKKYFKEVIFLDHWGIKEYSIKKAVENDKTFQDTYLEFGVSRGVSINFLSKFIKTNIYGFDSFVGLREDWVGSTLAKGHFDWKGQVPKTNKNVLLIKGWVQDTLPNFLKDKKPVINFVNMDMDTYKTSKFVLEQIKPYLKKNSIVLFDELYNYSGWSVGEYKALTETFNENEYKFLSFDRSGASAVIQII